MTLFHPKGTVPTNQRGCNAFGSITIPKSITYSLVRSGSLAGNNALRPQITGTDNTHDCYFGKLESGTPIPIEKFNSECWDGSGKSATPDTPIKRTDILFPGAASTALPFSFCLTNVTIE